jgi:hypothetical protein
MTRRTVPEKYVDQYVNYDDWVSSVGKPPGMAVSRTWENEFYMNKSRWNPGDVLWVRESWSAVEMNGMGSQQFAIFEDEWDGNIPKEGTPLRRLEREWKWGGHPSIHMPKSLCRIFLEVTEVRVERLLDISEEDAKAEGIEADGQGFKSYEIFHEGRHKGKKHPHAYIANLQAKTSFSELWESINGKDSWKENPWVWVITFKQISKPENFI